MKEGVIFVEKKFWEKVKSDRVRYVILDKLINSQSEIYTNYKKESCDDILNLIHQDTGGRLHWSKDINDYADSEDTMYLSSIYLIDKDTMFCDVKSTQRGVIVFNNSKFDSDDKVFSRLEPIPIDEDDKYNNGWRNELFAPILSNNKCNSIIINDKYLCKNGHVNPDLNNILDMVLPYHLEVPFHLSIFSQVDNNGNDIYEDIKHTIKSLRTQEFCNKDKFKFTLCYTTLHDRFIISNNYCIVAGAGFALFNGKNKPSNSTSLKIFFPTAIGEKREYNLWIKKTKEINDNTKNYWGDRINRLFDLV